MKCHLPTEKDKKKDTHMKNHS